MIRLLGKDYHVEFKKSYFESLQVVISVDVLCSLIYEYLGDASVIDDAIQFIQNVFLEQNTLSSRKIYVHLTNALDTQSMQQVIEEEVIKITLVNHMAR